MKLLSHNHLLCLNRNCKCNHALIIEPKKVIQIESEPKLAFMIHILSMIDYTVLVEAAKQIGIGDLPNSLPPKQVMESSESFLRSMQKVLLDSNVIEGKLTCSECNTSYLISNGVVDMMHPQKSKATKSERNENDEKDDEQEQNEDEEDEDDEEEAEEDVDMNAFLNDDEAQTKGAAQEQVNDRNDEDAANQEMIDID
mmetsp:Transcript_49789/g.79377  ORF Transcript_49789/g.79377 Transcript_49789/m.79377 type:complete len:198 (+) Transcript_49789:53-646(+)